MNPSASSETDETARRLGDFFDQSEVKWKPQAVKGNRAMAIAFIDARCVMDRLDEVVGVGSWHDAYVVHANGSVECQLSVRWVRADGSAEWITKADVGSESEQPDGGDRMKAAYSDALKRAAVRFGIGRYLYRLPAQWCDYDAQKRQFVNPPQLPSWAVPGKSQARQPAKTNAPAKDAAAIPANGPELHKRLRAADADLSGKGQCPVGALLTHVTQSGVKAGYGANLDQWAGPAIQLAIAEARAFKAKLQQPHHGGSRA